MSQKTIFVTGATGNQGSAVIKFLIEKEFKIIALTRNINGIKAQKYKLQKNIEVIQGNLNDENTYAHYLEGVDGIFSVQNFAYGISNEIRQGIRLANMAKKFRVKHFLYSSVFGADKNSGVPQLESKFLIEKHIKEIGIDHTIIRPTSFYENFLIPQVKKGIIKGKLVQPVSANTVLQYVSVYDLGRISAQILSDPGTYLGRTIEIAAEEHNGYELAEVFSTALHKKIKYSKLPSILIKLFLGKNLFKMFEFMSRKNLFIYQQVLNTEKEFPGMLSLNNWIRIHFN